jgi:hypothetical protein
VGGTAAVMVARPGRRHCRRIGVPPTRPFAGLRFLFERLGLSTPFRLRWRNAHFSFGALWRTISDGSCPGFSIRVRAVGRPESRGSWPGQDRFRGGARPESRPASRRRRAGREPRPPQPSSPGRRAPPAPAGAADQIGDPKHHEVERRPQQRQQYDPGVAHPGVPPARRRRRVTRRWLGTRVPPLCSKPSVAGAPRSGRDLTRWRPRPSSGCDGRPVRGHAGQRK